MEYRCVLISPCGQLELAEENGAITRLAFVEDLPLTPPCAPLLEQAAAQLEEYFAGQRREFSLPLAPAGTPFQQKVWRALCEIPYGQLCSYGQLAAKVGNPKASRAVGMANHRNPIAIIQPCRLRRRTGQKGAASAAGRLLAAPQTIKKRRPPESFAPDGRLFVYSRYAL